MAVRTTRTVEIDDAPTVPENDPRLQALLHAAEPTRDELAPPDPRESALANLLGTPTPVESDHNPPRPRLLPVPTGNTLRWWPDGKPFMVWQPTYPRMVGEPGPDGKGWERFTARAGDVVWLADDAQTQSHVALGYLIPEG